MFPKVYPREKYISRIRPFFDSDVIKVITGIRIRHFVYTGASANTDAAKMKKSTCTAQEEEQNGYEHEGTGTG